MKRTSEEPDNEIHEIRESAREYSNEDSDEEFTEIYVWGNDFYGQLGVGSDKCVHRIPKVCSFNIVIAQVACGEEHSAFISSNGGLLYSMGSNADGKLGIGEKTLQFSNVPCLVESLDNIKKVQCGMAHTLAINEKGECFASGQAFYGQLGLKDKSDAVYSPEKIESLLFEKIIDISAGSRHSLFLTSNNQVYSCGDQKCGSLGLGQSAGIERVMTPQLIQGELKDQKVTSFSCGKLHSLFLTSKQEVYSCGGNNFGQLGVGNKKNFFEPVKVHGLSNVKQVSCWHYSACLTNKNELYVWGTGIFGEHLTPKQMNFKEIENTELESIQVGGSFATLLDTKGRPMVWGANTNGELGLGDTTPRVSPTVLTSIEDKQIIQIGIGSAFAFALGQKMKNRENYQTFVDQEEGTYAIHGNNLNNPSVISEQASQSEETRHPSIAREQYQMSESSNNRQKDYQIQAMKEDIERLVDENEQLARQVREFQLQKKSEEVVDRQYNSINKLELEVKELNQRIKDKEKQLQLVRDDNAKYQAELGSSPLVDQLQKELDYAKSQETLWKNKCQELEQKMKDYDQIKSDLRRNQDENLRLRKEKDEIQQRFSKYQKEVTFKALPENRAHQMLSDKKEVTEPITRSIPNTPYDKMDTLDGMSPLQDQKSNLKIEDLAVKKELTYNPTYKLQVTDDKERVFYDRNYKDYRYDQRYEAQNREKQEVKQLYLFQNQRQEHVPAYRAVLDREEEYKRENVAKYEPKANDRSAERSDDRNEKKYEKFNLQELKKNDHQSYNHLKEMQSIQYQEKFNIKDQITITTQTHAPIAPYNNETKNSTDKTKAEPYLYEKENRQSIDYQGKDRFDQKRDYDYTYKPREYDYKFHQPNYQKHLTPVENLRQPQIKSNFNPDPLTKPSYQPYVPPTYNKLDTDDSREMQVIKIQPVQQINKESPKKRVTFQDERKYTYHDLKPLTDKPNTTPPALQTYTRHGYGGSQDITKERTDLYQRREPGYSGLPHRY